MTKKQYDNDIRLFNDIVRELRLNYRLTLLQFKDFDKLNNPLDLNNMEKYIEYKQNKRNNYRKLCIRLAKRLNIKTLDSILNSISIKTFY